MTHALLQDRQIVTVTGEPAETFLQALLTADVAAIGPGKAHPAALLTPQGKILFDVLASRIDGGFRLDVAAAARPAFLKRLALYRLRTPVVIAPADAPVRAAWNVGAIPAGALIDRRFPNGAVLRAYGEAPDGLGGDADADAFEAIRLRAGVAQAEADFPAGELFPHDVLLDQNGGVSFAKGCYVGQEVVSRMQHRGTARRRVMLLAADGHLTPGAPILAGEATVGTVLAAFDPGTGGGEGIGLVRIDRLAHSLRAGAALAADGVPVEASVPPWAGYALDGPSAEEGEP